MADKKNDNNNIFILTDIHPDASSVFLYKSKSIQDIKDECLVILDTNALLLPYAVGLESLDQIKTIYQKLVHENRLFIPGQVSREFSRNRSTKLTELFSQLSRKQNIQLNKTNYAILESVESYRNLLKTENDLTKLIGDYRKNISELLNTIKSWSWNDPVTTMYSDVFNNNVIFDLDIDKDEFSKDLERRINYNIPPGYKDASKSDNGMGDLLIWYTILKIGEIRNKDVIFVSGDEKPDWWHKSENQNIYPRYELVDEFRRKSGGNSFHIVSFSNMLKIFGVSKEVVEEVKNEESITHVVESKTKITSKNIVNRLDIINKSLVNWIKNIYALKSVYFRVNNNTEDPVDFIFSDISGNHFAVLVNYMGNYRISLSRFRRNLRISKNTVDNVEVDLKPIIFFVFNDELSTKNVAIDQYDDEFDDTSYVVGYIDDDEIFHHVYIHDRMSL
ncbi:hypothetical protein F8S13_11975 [Chloroflexia bacterium SDU3-3]|nr:hypothetical protein F8S13_11975 [Chloroflexia bacterium SDU3-3]